MSTKKKAVVFYARDFLSKAFPDILLDMNRIERIFITINSKETKRVKARAPSSTVLELGHVYCSLDTSENYEYGANPNRDRFLRDVPRGTINKVNEACAQIVRSISDKFEVIYYVDEPVSGFINEYFNNHFTALGATCCHFQTSWVPGFMFFSKDRAQGELVQIDVVGEMHDLVRDHVERRSLNQGKPRYVLDYNGVWGKITAVGYNYLVCVYKYVFRRRSFYLDANFSPNLYHARCVRAHFFTKYKQRSNLDSSVNFIFYPLHYEPECILGYYSDYLRQVDIVNELIDHLPANYEIILKEHPSQPGALGTEQWKQIRKNARVNIISGLDDFRNFTDLKLKVVTLGSSLGLDALVYGIPVYSIGRVHYESAPGVKSIMHASDVYSTEVSSSPNVQDLVAWYAQFMKKYCIMCEMTPKDPDFSAFAKLLDKKL